jgi:hypothetical protein
MADTLRAEVRNGSDHVFGAEPLEVGVGAAAQLAQHVVRVLTERR